MTTWFEPLQRKTDMRWDMTSHNTSRSWTHPVGYCAGWKEVDEAFCEKFHFSVEQAKAEKEEDRKFQSKYHTDGHATSEEAHDCYTEYSIDHAKIFDDRADATTFHRCEHVDGCPEITSGIVEVGPLHTCYHLCKNHRSREDILKLHKSRP